MGFWGVQHKKSQSLAEPDLLQSLCIQISKNILQLAFNNANTWNCKVLRLSILNKSHFHLVGNRVGACRAGFKF